MSQRQFAEKLGTKYHTVSNWITRGIRPADEIIERFLVLLSEAKKINPEIAIEPPSAVTVKNKQIAEEIRQILNYFALDTSGTRPTCSRETAPRVVLD